VADEKKNLQTLVDPFVLQAMGGRVIKTQNQAAKARFQRIEESPRRPFHQGNFVINWQHDPRDRVAGDVSHQRDDRISCGSIEQF
jgi:hypothetical protein